MDKFSDVVIRRRAHGEAEAVKGGAWKVAHADFMTAMMAFFLVMWLVSTTDPEVRQGVANYFNPIQLTTTEAAGKGLNDPKSKSGSSDDAYTAGDASEAGNTGRRAGGMEDGEGSYPEAQLFADPYGAIDAIERRETEAGRSRRSAAAMPRADAFAAPAATEAAPRDPFDPASWARPVPPSAADLGAGTSPGDDLGTGTMDEAGLGPGTGEEETDAAAADRSADAAADSAAAPPAPPPPAASSRSAAPSQSADPSGSAAAPPAPEAPRPAATAARTPAPPAAAGAPVAETSDAGSPPAPSAPTVPASRDTAAAPETAPPGPAPGGSASDGAASAATGAERLADALRRALASLAAGSGPLVEVEPVEGGVLVNLTEAENRSMFASASAAPTPELARVVDRIAAVVGTVEGPVVVCGHTDARPFRGKGYDNWRLSTARAHMAAYMLIHGGLPEARIERIEGYADRRPRRPEDPLAAENRRIEILVRTETAAAAPPAAPVATPPVLPAASAAVPRPVPRPGVAAAGAAGP